MLISLQKIGVKEVHSLKIETRLDATTSKEYQDILSQCTGIFMTGGNQLLLSTTLGGTPVVQLIHRLNAKGVNVAGTSAGTIVYTWLYDRRWSSKPYF